MPEHTHVPTAAGANSSQPTGRTYFPELDGVRAIAISMVMAFHMPLGHPIILGQTGVDLFFVLSGFLITGILLKSPQNDWHEVRTFYIRRTLRIFPLYYAFLLVFHFLLHGEAFPLYWIYLQNMYLSFSLFARGPMHFWSLAIEEQFYLVWPFLVLFLPRRRLMPTFLLFMAGAFLCRFPLIHWNISTFYFTLSRVDALAAGGILSLLLYRGQLTQLRRPMAALCIVCGVLLGVEGKVAALFPHTAWIQATKFSLLALFYAAGLGLILISKPNPLIRVLRSKPLRFVGRLAYGLYIFHPYVFTYTFKYLPHEPKWVKAPLAVLLAFACALISWYGMERYFIGLKDRLAPEKARFSPASPPMTAV